MARDLWYELRDAISKRDFKRASELLERSPDLINRRNSLGETVLHFLAVENDVEGIEWLHNKGAKLDTKNDFGTPAVFEVAQLGYKDLLRWFIEKDVDLKATNEDEKDIFAYLKENEKDEMIDFLKSNSPDE